MEDPELKDIVIKRLYITRQDIKDYKPSIGCRGCEAVNRGKSGIPHNERCRRRIEREMQEKDPDRINKELERMSERILENKKRKMEEDKTEESKEEDKAMSWVCANCGKDVEVDWKHCKQCGNDVTEEAESEKEDIEMDAKQEKEEQERNRGNKRRPEEEEQLEGENAGKWQEVERQGHYSYGGASSSGENKRSNEEDSEQKKKQLRTNGETQGEIIKEVDVANLEQE